MACAARLGALLPESRPWLLRAKDDEVEAPLLDELVPVLKGFGKVMERVEEQHWNIRCDLANHVQQHHTIGLEAGRHAGTLGGCEMRRDGMQDGLHETLLRLETN